MKKHILMVGGWNAIFHKMQNLDIDFSYLGPIVESEAFHITDLERAQYYQSLDHNDIGHALYLAKQWHAEHPFDGVISFTENGLEMAAVLAEALRIPGLNLDAVMITRKKDVMREVLQSDPSLSIPWHAIHKEADLRAFFLQQDGGPIIVKPISGAGSMGVYQIRTDSDLDQYLCEYPLRETSEVRIAERFIDVNETYSIETLSVEGQHHILAMSYSKNTGQPYNLVSHTLVPPPPVSEAQFMAIEDTIKRFLTVIGLNDGVAHTELKIDGKGQVFIIESQTRVGGDRIWQMAEWYSGVDQIGSAIRLLYEPKLHVPPIKPEGAAGFFCLLPPAGSVKSVQGLEALKAADDVVEYAFNVQPGQMLCPITDNTHRKGYVLLRAQTQEALLSRIQELFKKICVEYENGKRWHPTLA